MTNKELYQIMDSLGMISDDTNCDEDAFELICKDAVTTINFVNELCLYNDLETIKQFLIALFINNGKKNND